jgi:hypothetical protein
MSRKIRRKRFEGKWLLEEGVGEVVKTAWDAGIGENSGDVAKAVASVREALHAWDGTVLKKPRARLWTLARQLEEVLRGEMSEENARRQEELTVDIERILEQEEVYKMQRSRVNWLSHGDRNSAFFHNYAKARKKMNLIVKLKDAGGTWREGNASIKPIIQDYFSQLFTSEVDNTSQELLQKVKPRVTAEMNERLIAPFTEKEVKEALFAIGDFKAPGTDGMHAIFFKKFWPFIEDAVTKEVLVSLQTGVIPTGWNETAIILIPKVNDPELITQFRPISLCNVLYKIISKVLANRLKVILPEIISIAQSAFVPGRLITDNVLVAYECVHALRGKREGKDSFCAVKLDMHKAYDRVEWSFLKDMMTRLGFSEQWTNLIMSCVSSVQYRVWFNDDETDTFTPTRGLRQGDPLSPYLFLICAEGLSSLLTHEEESGGIQGVRVCRGAPSVSHLLFADDSLILMKADAPNAAAVRRVLDLYCASSGQLVSDPKSSIFFSPNTKDAEKGAVCAALHIDSEALTEKYLGLPSHVGVDRSDCFQHLVDRVCKIISGWNLKNLSMGGKEILLKAVAQAIPSYAMSVFKLPKGICKAIAAAIARFWCGE